MDDEKREDALEYASVSLLEYACNKFHCFLMQVSLGAAAKERSKPKPKARIHSSLHRLSIVQSDHAEDQAAPSGAEGPTTGRGPQHYVNLATRHII